MFKLLITNPKFENVIFMLLEDNSVVIDDDMSDNVFIKSDHDS